MHRITIRLLAALLTFAIGTASYALISSFRGLLSPDDARRPNLSVSIDPKPSGSPLTLSGACGCNKDTGIGKASAPADSTEPLRTISGGILNGKAIRMPQPPYPPIAKTARASGTVVVQIIVDGRGCIVSARAVSGHPLLQAAAVAAARQACFSPTRLRGEPVMVSGVITYNFVLS